MSPTDIASVLASLAAPAAAIVLMVRFYFVFDRKATDRINEAEKDAVEARAATRAADRRADDERRHRLAAETSAARLEVRAAGLEAQIEALREEIVRLRGDIDSLRGHVV